MLLLFLFHSIRLALSQSEHIYAGKFDSLTPLPIINLTKGSSIFRKSEDDELKLSILLQSSESLLFIQAFLNDTNSMSIEDQEVFIYSFNYRVSSKANLNCSEDEEKETVDCEFQSDSFSFNISTAKMKRNEIQEPIVSYSFVISCVSITLILAFSKHTQECIASERAAQKTSIEFLILQSAIDFWYSVWHLYLSYVYYLAHEYLILAGFMTFSVYLVIHGRLLTTAWKAQNPALAQEGQVLFRIKFALFEGYWIMFILSFIPLFIIFRKEKVLIVLVTHNYLPLIYKNARNGYKYSIKPNILITITIARLLLVLYLFGLNHEFMDRKEDYWACLVFVIYFSVQTAVVLVQNKCPRFFVPNCLRPTVYSYFRDEEYEKMQENTECNICMTGLNLAGQRGEVYNFSKTWHTPCKHMFHEECLKTWMTIKMECPTCRSALPFIDDE